MSRATCDPIDLLYFIKPALGFIQVIGRMLHKTQNFTPFDSDDDIMGSHVARDITMPRTVRMVCLWFKSIWNIKLKRSTPQEVFQSFWKLRENMEGLSFDAESDLWISIKCMENIIMDKSSLMKGVDDNDDDDHEYPHCYYYHHHHHPHQNHYLHISSIAYLYVTLTLHLNQNHLGTSGHILVSLRKDHLSDWLMKDFIFNSESQNLLNSSNAKENFV